MKCSPRDGKNEEKSEMDFEQKIPCGQEGLKHCRKGSGSAGRRGSRGMAAENV